MYLEAIEMKNEQEIKDRDKQIQEVMKQNTILVTLVQDQQQKIEELLKQIKEIMEAMMKETQDKNKGVEKRKNKDNKK